jgi:uncharacterized protein YndB with AHSA1/START domain
MTSAKPSEETVSDREIVITRVFHAPRELVFDAWTDPRHISSWWGPKGFTTTIHEMDVRPGGNWRLTMHGPDGTDYKNRIVFIEVKRPERLIYAHQPEHGTEAVTFETTVTFADLGASTRLTLRMLFATAAARNHVVEKHHAIEGGEQTLARLAEHLATKAGTGVGQEVVITRILDIPRDVVFKAWIDPEQLKQWWGPKGFTNPVCEVDPRPGGAIRIDMRAPDGVVYPMTGVYLEVVEPERLVFTSMALDKEGNALFENLNTVTFAEHGKQTKLTLHAKVAKTTEQGLPYLSGMNEGWKMTLDRLEAYSKR